MSGLKPRNKADPKAGGNYEDGSRAGKHVRNPGYKPGENWLECQRCGLDHYASDARREWTGSIVCKSCWEPRHPQDFVRSKPEQITADGPINVSTLGVGGDPKASGTRSEDTQPSGTFDGSL